MVIGGSVPRNIWKPYLTRYRITMAKLRSSSHTLEVERGIYSKPKTNICERLFPGRNVIEDEIQLYDTEGTHFLGKVTAKLQNLHELNDAHTFILLMSSKDKQIVVWTGKFIINAAISAPGFISTMAAFSPVFRISYISRDTTIQGIDLVLMLSWNVYWNTMAVVTRTMPSLAPTEVVIQWQHP